MSNERLRWLSDILNERFGHIVTLEDADLGLIMRLPQFNGSILFKKKYTKFIKPYNNLPCIRWNATSEGWDLPIIESLVAPGLLIMPVTMVEKHGSQWVINYDVLGLISWMLTRIEEVNSTKKDNHGRFPSSNSHASIHNYLSRPIVDEWLCLVRLVIQLKWPDLKLRCHKFKIRVSHDVDRPFQYLFLPAYRILRTIIADLVKRRSPKTAFQRLARWLSVKKGNLQSDPFNTFDWIMEVSEANNLQSAFYFVTGRASTVYDPEYNISHSSMRALLRKIHLRGHEIGLHPSYMTYLDANRLKAEARKLREVCHEENITQSHWGGRMHYLRWRHPETLRALVAAEMTYDSTFSYADCPGFRCGTCFDYPAFDPVSDQSFDLRIRPLIAMDTSLFGGSYQNLSVKEAHQRLSTLKRNCKAVGGTFSLLWHNCSFASQSERDLYVSILTDC